MGKVPPPSIPDYLSNLPDSALIGWREMCDIFHVSRGSINAWMHARYIPAPDYTKSFRSCSNGRVVGIRNSKSFKWKLGEVRKFIKTLEHSK